MGIEKQYDAASNAVAGAAYQAGFTSAEVGMIIDSREIESCVRVVRTIEKDHQSVGVSKKRAMQIVIGSRTIIKNAEHRARYWMKKRKKTSASDINARLVESVRIDCGKLLGDPLKKRAEAVANEHERTSG